MTLPDCTLPLLDLVADPDEFREQINTLGWFLPFCILLFPVTLALFLMLGKAICAFLGIGQVGVIVFGARAVISHFRQEGFTSFQVKLAMIPLYIVICFATNLVAILSLWAVHRFF